MLAGVVGSLQVIIRHIQIYLRDVCLVRLGIHGRLLDVYEVGLVWRAGHPAEVSYQVRHAGRAPFQEVRRHQYIGVERHELAVIAASGIR